MGERRARGPGVQGGIFLVSPLLLLLLLLLRLRLTLTSTSSSCSLSGIGKHIYFGTKVFANGEDFLLL